MKVIFAKCCLNRKKEYQIETAIGKINDQLVVRKRALTSASIPHVSAISKNYSSRNGKYGQLEMATSSLQGEDCILEYAEGQTFEQLLLDAASKCNYELFYSYIYKYLNIVSELPQEDVDEFTPSHGFQEFFGSSIAHDFKRVLKKPNIDCTLGNLVLSDSKIVAIDYEWFVDFDVPLSFILFRSFYHFFKNHEKKLTGFIEFSDLMKIAIINEKSIETFSEWEQHFQSKILECQTSVSVLSPANRYRRSQQMETNASAKFPLVTKLYLDINEGFTESCSLLKDACGGSGYFNYSFRLNNFRNISRVRWDPVECIWCEIHDLQIHVTTEEGVTELLQDAHIQSNAYQIEGSKYIFKTLDPQIIISGLDSPLMLTFSGFVRVPNWWELVLFISNQGIQTAG